MAWTTTVAGWGAAMVAGLLVAACGGGGGGGDGGGNPPPPGGALEGRLWHTNYGIDFRDGAQIASLEGAAPVQVTAELPAWPWADGSQYATTDPDSDSTVVRVYSLASGAQLHAVEFEGYLRELRPSPVSKSVILATWGEDSVSTPYVVFYDLATRQVLDLFEQENAEVDWLPDGRYLRVAANGALSTGTVGGSRTAGATLALPAGRELMRIGTSRNGAQLWLALAVRAQGGGIDESDLWLANADGSGLKRFTSTRITSYGEWSPEGDRVAFDADTGLVCGGGTCVGSCALWHGKATAQNLTALAPDDNQGKFSVKNRSGQDGVLGCELQAWTN